MANKLLTCKPYDTMLYSIVVSIQVDNIDALPIGMQLHPFISPVNYSPEDPKHYTINYLIEL